MPKTASPVAKPPCLQLNAPQRIKVSLRRLGRDRNPVLVLDDVLANAEEIREHALGFQFRPTRSGSGYYPGYVVTCPLRGATTIGRWAAEVLWERAYASGRSRLPGLAEVEVDAFFALYSPAARFEYTSVHVDGHSWLASILYLTPGQEKESGTVFWRHQPTGLESLYNGVEPLHAGTVIETCFGIDVVDRQRAALVQSGERTYAAWMASISPRARAPFPDDDHGDWKKIGSVSARFNRLVVYPTWQFHSIMMNGRNPRRSMRAARLTLNGFVKHELLERLPRMPVSPLIGVEHE